MKKIIIALIITIMLQFVSCASYQIGSTIEPRNEYNAIGLFFAGDYAVEEMNLYPLEIAVEQSILYLLPFSLNNKIVDKTPHFGYNLYGKYRIYLLNDNLCFIPIIGYELHYTHIEKAEKFKEKIDMGISFGAGFDLLFLYPFVINGKVVYQPQFSSFMGSESGFRYSVSFGYRMQPLQRTKKEEERIKREKEQKENEERDRKKQDEEKERERIIYQQLELANAAFRNKNYTDAIMHFRYVLKQSPNNYDARAGLTNAWNKRIEENSDHYPVPFEGKWKFKYPDENEPIYKTVTRTRLQDYSTWEPAGKNADGSTRFASVGRTREVEYQEKVFSHYKVIPGEIVEYEFSGINYTRTSDKVELRNGTFYYSNSNIELYDGTILKYSNNIVILDNLYGLKIQ